MKDSSARTEATSAPSYGPNDSARRRIDISKSQGKKPEKQSLSLSKKIVKNITAPSQITPQASKKPSGESNVPMGLYNHAFTGTPTKCAKSTKKEDIYILKSCIAISFCDNYGQLPLPDEYIDKFIIPLGRAQKGPKSGPHPPPPQKEDA